MLDSPFVTAPLLMVLAHYVADFAMQTEFMATMKGRVHEDAHGWHSLIAHCAHHGALSLAVGWWVSGYFEVGVIAMLLTGITHGIIDYLKAVKGAFSVTVDQVLHLSVAVGVGLLIAAGM